MRKRIFTFSPNHDFIPSLRPQESRVAASGKLARLALYITNSPESNFYGGNMEKV